MHFRKKLQSLINKFTVKRPQICSHLHTIRKGRYGNFLLNECTSEDFIETQSVSFALLFNILKTMESPILGIKVCKTTRDCATKVRTPSLFSLIVHNTKNAKVSASQNKSLQLKALLVFGKCADKLNIGVQHHHTPFGYAPNESLTI